MPAIPYLSVLEFHGSDALSFLHNQLSADIAALAHGEATFACLCQPKGRVIALLLVQAAEDGALVVCARELAATVRQRLAMYVLRDDVAIRERPDLEIHGTDSDSGAGLIRPLPGLAYRLHGKEASADGNPQAWKARELEHGVCWLGAATSEQFLPQMLGCESIGALSFRKGCFPGQEIIARTRYLGKLKRNALLARISATISPDPLESVSLTHDEEEASAVIVDLATLEGGTLLFLVARAQTDFYPSAMHYLGKDCAIEGHWIDKGVR